MNITFDDNLITGNKTIDSQHQELIDRIRQFVAACESGDSKIITFCFKIDTVCGFTLLLYQQSIDSDT